MRIRFLFPPALALSLAVAGLPAAGQSFTGTAATSVANSSAPVSDSVPAPQPKWHETEPPADKLISAAVAAGTLTIDGLVAKVHLNYVVHNQGYLYFFIPGVGTAIVSRVDLPGSERVESAFNGSRLDFTVGGHSFELTSRRNLVAAVKMDAYVTLDTSTVALDKYPMMGYGSTARAPYAWPLSGTEPKDSYAHYVQPPPMPSSVLPRTGQ